MQRAVHRGETYGNTIEPRMKSTLPNNEKKFWIELDRADTPEASIESFFKVLSTINKLPKVPDTLRMLNVGLIIRDANGVDIDPIHIYDIYWFKCDNDKLFYSHTKLGPDSKVGVQQLF